ncbi:MAG: DnaA/Hda family protein, partial [Pseudomonadota bacterium]
MAEDIWGNVRSGLTESIGTSAFKTWIEPLEFNGCSNGVAYLTAPTSFIGNWVSQHYGERIQRLIREHGETVSRLDFSVARARRVRAGTAYASSAPKAEFAEEPANPIRVDPKSQQPQSDMPGSPLDARYRFDSFVVGKPNELAHAAARRVAEGGPVTFNPLFLYGGVGLGKTHLMHAIAWELQAASPAPKVLYVSAEQFMYRFVQALRF